MTPTSIAAYLVLFASVGFLFVFAALLLGWFLRAKVPTPEKQATYECGEPAIGSSFIQFDLRFYVVALLFIIFDVEVAFFFPWATVFGKATQLMDPYLEKVVESRSPSDAAVELSPAAKLRYRELGIRRPEVPDPAGSVAENTARVEASAGRLALAAALDIGVFFAVLLVGFVYLWRRGDLDWVRPASVRRSAAVRPAERFAGTAMTP